MLPRTQKINKIKKNKIKIKIKIVICKNFIIPKASPAPNGSIKEKLKSRGKCPNTAKKKKIQYQWKYLNLVKT